MFAVKDIKLRTDTKKPFHDLIKIIHFAEKLSAKIHGLQNEPQIYKTVKKEFAKSKKYTASILLLEKKRSKLQIVEAILPSKKVKLAEKIAKTSLKAFRINLKKSTAYRQVVKKGKTIQVSVGHIVAELFPKPVARLIVKIMSLEKRQSILTPLKKHGKVIGAFGMSSTSLAKHFTPSVKNLARHISTALELACEQQKCLTAEKALQQSQARYRALFKNAPVGIGLATPKGQVLEYNKEVLRLTGYSAKEIKQINLKSIYKNPKERERLLKRLQTDGFVRNFEAELKRKSGAPYYVSLTIIPSVSDGPDTLLTVIEDITKRKKTEQKLKKAKADIEKKVKKAVKRLKKQHQTQQNLFINLAHQLKTPLTILKGDLELARGKHKQKISKNLKNFNQFLASQREEVEKIEKTINDLSTLAKAETGQIKLNFQQVRLEEVVKNVCRRLKKVSKKEKKQLLIKKLMPAAITGDQEKLEQLVSNLLENAIKFTRPRTGKIEISLSSNQKRAKLQVKDNGIGILKKDLPYLFKRFFQAANIKYYPRLKGSGLGLAICQWIVKKHHGQITVKSKKGIGSQFSVLLPLKYSS